MSPRPRSTVKPVRVYNWNAELRVQTTRIVGYRAVCDCDYRGSTRAAIRDARADRRAHALEHLGNRETTEA